MAETNAAKNTPADDDANSEAGRRLGGIKTEAKSASSRRNGLKGGRPVKPLEEIVCTCGGTGLAHKTYCPRGQAILRRKAAGKAIDVSVDPNDEQEAQKE